MVTVYEGEWDRHQWHGAGTWKSPDGSGDIYHGRFDHGKKCGTGRMLLGDGGSNSSQGGGSYVGEWKDDLFHGRGVRLWANGDRYDGQWLQKSSPEFVLLDQSLAKLKQRLQGATQSNAALASWLKELSDLKATLAKKLNDSDSACKKVLGQTLTVQNSESEIQECARNISTLTKKVWGSKSSATSTSSSTSGMGNSLMVSEVTEPQLHQSDPSFTPPFQLLCALSDTLAQLRRFQFDECTKLADKHTVLSKELSEQVSIGGTLHKAIEETQRECSTSHGGVEPFQGNVQPAATTKVVINDNSSRMHCTSSLNHKNNESNVCMECDERPPYVQLQPCGHVVLCSQVLRPTIFPINHGRKQTSRHFAALVGDFLVQLDFCHPQLGVFRVAPNDN
ncbi:hypothetical protein Pelo_17294 [Pelomyxa schiedti]|nr:hypothetical protein Pelo_17294 [Pelomyxa schiedti]